MLTGAVYRQLAEVNRLAYAAVNQAEAREHADQVVRTVQDAQAAITAMAQLFGADRLPKSSLGQHLHWLGYRYARGEHDQYATDVDDIRDRDLPALADFVAQWERSLLDPGLAAAIERAWTDRNFLAVVRDAFVYLEHRLREVGRVDQTKGLTGDALVTLLLGPKARQKLALPTGTLLGPVTGGEDTGLMHLFKGAFLFARNPTAHRPIEYRPEEAYALVGLVDLCLRIIDPAPRM
ncbi:MAG: TIGR02391 family protein [Actinomycetota bacterium]|nr:TIGR02391 family protein [Actinomycetota bacterium]